MEMRRLGRSGLRVSALGLGTLRWGRDTLPDEAGAQLETFLEAGGNLVDTSPTYGDGLAEGVLGELMGKVARREDLVIVSKAGLSAGEHSSPVHASRPALLQNLESSLKALGTDYLDLWMIQVPDPHTDFDAVLSTAWSAWSSGKARLIGLSNHTGWQCAYAAAKLGGTALPAPGLAAAENEYSLLNRSIEADVIPAAQSLGYGVLAWSALGRGVLSGKYRNSTPPDSRGASIHLQGFVQPYLAPASRRIVESVATAAQGLDTSVLAVSLAWQLSRPGISSSLVGARTVEQLKQILRGAETKLPRQLIDALDEVSATPGS